MQEVSSYPNPDVAGEGLPGCFMNSSRETALGFQISDLGCRIYERILKTFVRCIPNSAFRNPNAVAAGDS